MATFWYAATTATKGGQSLTVFTAPDAATATWQPVNVASGNTESRMFTAARGALVFSRTPDRRLVRPRPAPTIRPLNPAATKSIGTAPITVAAYQDLVATRYSDKLPGTHYADQGTAGGYDSPPPPPTDTYNDLILPITAAVALLLALAVALHHRRRKPLPPTNPATLPSAVPAPRCGEQGSCRSYQRRGGGGVAAGRRRPLVPSAG